MAYNTILFTADGAVATITLNRPDKLNSFTAEMHRELRDAIGQVCDGGTARCLLLTGAGRGFCAGQDLSDRVMGDGAAPPDLGHTLASLYNPLVMGLRALPMPVVCAVNGVAAGAGANLALGCDIVLAARSASFIEAFCRLGLVPDAGGTYILPRLAGTARAMGLAMLGDKLSAEQAADWGLIWKVVDDDKLMDEAGKLARHLASQPTKGLALIKRAIHASPANTLEQQLALEATLQREAGRTHDYREGVAAFMGKRPPRFTGT
ncbi:MAG: 2-(1,2-epoxy-1,2-dihydrophenyl)acetyl-CoA isomerase [Alphaproteobacteria bacterium]|nr:2-(1,2-epoxy-1,2-dihydrophenyl)acetyl-CoA isomerase [Alphaproteobacteria bacterium]